MSAVLIEEGYDFAPQQQSGDWLRFTKDGGDQLKVRFVSRPLHYTKQVPDFNNPSEVVEKTVHLWRVIDRADGKAKLFEQGNQIYMTVRSWATDPEWGDPSDPETGYDVTITRNKDAGPSGYYTCLQGRNATPLTKDELAAIAEAEAAMPLEAAALAAATSDPHYSKEQQPQQKD